VTNRWNLPVVFLLIVAALAACATPATPVAPTATPPAPAVPSMTPPPQPSATAEPHTLTVFAAASLTDAFTEIGKAFEAANPGVTVVFNFANSRALCTQIEEGAVADVFASANTKEMDTLAAAGMVGEAQPFVNNLLTIIVPPDNPAGLSTPQDLTQAGLKLVLAAEEAPLGKYAREVLGKLDVLYGTGYKDAVLANVVSNEDNVKQVVAKVQLGEADAGIVYTSDVVAAPELVSIEIPAEQNVIAVYPIAVLQASSELGLAQAFIDYVLSDEGQAVLRAWGFSPPA
jgi:molybdate transport system substrate-binding protein